MLIPPTMTLPGTGRPNLSVFLPGGFTLRTSPVRPRSLPLVTITVSVLRILFIYTTSGASETIFMKLRSRSSLATGPKMRVPRGLKSSSRITAAFSSKRMYEPSARRQGCAVRTTTAFTTSPFFTALPGDASFTEATTTSPTLP